MPKPKPADFKETALRDHSALNPRTVHDELFAKNEFFDPRDLSQVKYEMLREVHEEGQSVSQSAKTFGFSLPSFYKIQADFDQEGVAGLLPRKRGRRGRHKLTTEVLEFAEVWGHPMFPLSREKSDKIIIVKSAY
jgi:hypothetical protein